MSERTRNIAVGLTVLVAILLVIGMIVIFTTLPAVFRGGYPIRLLSDSRNGIEAGYPVNFAGVPIGYVQVIRFTDPSDPSKGVTITARIDRNIRLPGNTNAYILTTGFVGSPYIDLKASGPARSDPRTGKPLAYLPTDDSVPLQIMQVTSGLIPEDVMASLQEIRLSFREVGLLAKNVNDMLGLPTTAPAAGNAASAPTTAPAGTDGRALLAKLAKTLDGVNAMVGDTDNQANLKTTLANLAKISAQGPELMESLKETLAQARGTLQKADGAIQTVSVTVDKAGGSVDKLTVKLLDTVDKLSVLLTSLGGVVAKIESSEGTAGKLLNDPKLYNNLLEITSQITGLTKEFRALLESWEKSGVGIKLK
jgi:phospholipid/cholesterol/gamma-HCH transport system substrate-binding protein